MLPALHLDKINKNWNGFVEILIHMNNTRQVGSLLWTLKKHLTYDFCNKELDPNIWWLHVIIISPQFSQAPQFRQFLIKRNIWWILIHFFFFRLPPFGYRLYASVSISAYLLNSEVPQNQVLNTSFHVYSFLVDLSHSMNVDTMYNLINANYIFNSNFPPRSRLVSNHPLESYIEFLLGISNSSIVPYMLSDFPWLCLA